MNWINKLKTAWIVFRAPICRLDIEYNEWGNTTATLKMILNNPKEDGKVLTKAILTKGV